jgi:hypothetical protein
MKFRNTLILLIIAIAAVAYIWFIDREKPTKEESEQQAKTVLKIDPTSVEEIILERPESKVNVILANGTWAISSPIQTQADQTVISGILDQVDTLAATYVVDTTTTELNQYGLDYPTLTFGVRLKGEGNSQKIQIGDLNTIGDGYYAKLEQGDIIFLVPKSLVDNQLKRSLFDLREKKIIKINQGDATKFQLTNADNTGFLLERDVKAAEWKLIQPVTYELDQGKVSNLISRACNLTVKEFVEEELEDFSPFGFNPPLFSVTVWAGTDSVTVDVGNQRDSSGFYARVTGLNKLLLVDTTSVKNLHQPYEDLRKRELFNFTAADITSIELHANGETIFAERDSQNVWTVKPERTFEESRLNLLTSSLANTRVKRFVRNDIERLDKLGLDNPSYSWIITTKLNEVYKLHVGQKTGEEYFAYLEGKTMQFTIAESLINDTNAFLTNQE